MAPATEVTALGMAAATAATADTAAATAAITLGMAAVMVPVTAEVTVPVMADTVMGTAAVMAPATAAAAVTSACRDSILILAAVAVTKKERRELGGSTQPIGEQSPVGFLFVCGAVALMLVES